MAEIWWVASGNPVKARALRLALRRLWPEREFAARPLPLASGVAAQPFGEAETRRGARLRAENAHRLESEGAGWVGLEGGVTDIDGALYGLAWAAVGAPLNGRFHISLARSASFPLPVAVAERVRGGQELGAADDAVFGVENSKQAGGAVGLLSGGALQRDELYAMAVLLALLPFRNPQLRW